MKRKARNFSHCLVFQANLVKEQVNIKGGKFLKKLVLHRWGVLQDNLVSSTGLIM